MISGNADQEPVVNAVTDLMYRSIMPDRPTRMLLAHETMPRYSRMSPESANMFDNLHMRHGIAYSIMAYDKWSVERKRAEIYSVIRAMSCLPGDERYAREFRIATPIRAPILAGCARPAARWAAPRCR